ncbi:hypothetical protein N658DRAFT_494964 [Parathielavia hyrcaniae]|uniref:CFEM domain-containing protein n=1 Tax=Parathielavia hyrcaniae TaxID=113614 RepID=A0AAN6Q3I3_9PEZI|nr:hypothetical protein N658DRAFT_494964 [Parathielavia hyrcaniae]
MKEIAFFLAAASVALAQNLSGQPSCATSCLISAISAAGCGPSDMSCQCGPTQAAIGLGAAPCLLWSCSADELMQAQSAGSAQCSIYSVTRKGSDLPASNTGAVSSGFYKG